MKTNWKQVGIELETWRIPAQVVEKFERDGDAGAFRVAARTFGVSDDAIDWKINEIEAVQ